MACEYESYSVFEQFTDAAILEKAINRMEYRGDFTRQGLKVETRNYRDMNALKQAYQVEAARAALKKKGFFVSEKKQENGKILLTVRA
jgi:hypothetical protein